MKQSYSKWADLIKREIKSNFLSTSEILVSPKLNKKDPFVSLIGNIGQHAPVSQILGKAVFDLTQADTALASTNDIQFYGNVWAAWNKKTKDYEKAIKNIVEAIQ